MGLYDPILTGVGLLQNGALTPTARKTYVSEVLALLATGNDKGQGGSPTTQIFNHLVPLPPAPGPTVFNVTTLQSEPLFWFGPDPFAALMSSQLSDPNNNPIWQAIFPDLIYGKTAVALDLPGHTPLLPVFDPTFLGIPFPPTLPDLAVKLKIPGLTLPQLIAKLSLSVSLPKVPLPPIPPKLPNIALPIPPHILLDFCIGLIKLPFTLLLKLLLPPSLSLVPIPSFSAIMNLAFEIVVQLMIDLNLMLITPKLLVASILIYLKDVVAMVATVLVGSIVGTGGLATAVATMTGLV